MPQGDSPGGNAPLTTMTKEERQQSLTNARRAVRWLGDFLKFPPLPDAVKQEVGFLIAGFELLDAKEQAQIKAGNLGATHGKKGGRPKTKLS